MFPIAGQTSRCFFEVYLYNFYNSSEYKQLLKGFLHGKKKKVSETLVYTNTQDTDGNTEPIVRSEHPQRQSRPRKCGIFIGASAGRRIT
jgi:hypothetical protein